MAAFERGRRAYPHRKRLGRSHKILSRRKKLHSKPQRRMKVKHVSRYARSCYQKKRLPMSRYCHRRTMGNELSSRKVKCSFPPRRPSISYRSKSSHGKPGRPKKKDMKMRSRLLQAKRRKKVIKKRTKRVVKKTRRRRYSDDEIFYSLANSSKTKGASEEKLAKKHSVHFTTPGSTKTTDMEQQEDLSNDSQSSQQTGTPKKRSRSSATPICKSH